MKRLLIFLLAGFLFSGVMAQVEQEGGNDMGQQKAARWQSNSIYGKLIDKGTGKPIAASSVQIYSTGNNRDTALNGMLSKPNGEFRFKNLPKEKNFRLVITALGYETLDQVVTIDEHRAKEGVSFFEKDMGNLLVATKIKQLDAVVVTSSRPALQMGIDRKIFSVEKSLVAAGGTAVDIMKNIPSVSVDIDGNVELRNSTPQIFIDGRPTILTLDQVAADQIDKIELITNPSAKFDAASSGGIINIVLKKNKRIGLNGVASISGGTPKLFSSNLNLNLRQDKFNFFVSAGHNQSGGKARGHTLRQNKKAGVITDYFKQNSVNNRSRNFNSIRFGADYFINNRNTITLSQSFVEGRFASVENQDQQYFSNSDILQRYGVRVADGKSTFNRRSTRLNYTFTFPKAGQEFTADVSYNTGTRSDNSDINNDFFNPDGSPFQASSLVWNDGSSREKQLTVQADYTNPISENSKIEAGVRTYHNNYSSYFNAFANDNGRPVKLPLSNNYTYDDMINAAYATFSHQKKDFSYQAGLRAEHSKFNGELVDSAYKFGYEYPKNLKNIWDALFPSFFVTQKISDSAELQFNFSRRINRPRFWQLNPFIDINDPVNLRQGNPQLQPEFVNSFELNYSKNYPKGNFLGVLYFRSNPRDITQYSDTITAAQYQLLNNAAVDPNAILNTFINANTTMRYGAEFTLQHKAGKNFDITPTFNLQYRTVNAKVKTLNLSNKGFNWETKLIINYKTEGLEESVFNNMGFQLTGEYESPRVIPQGTSLAQYELDIAIRKDFLENKKASLTLAVSDVFNSQRWGNIYDTEQFYQDSYRRWDVRNFRLTFSYKFGDSKFSLFKSGDRGGNNDDN